MSTNLILRLAGGTFYFSRHDVPKAVSAAIELGRTPKFDWAGVLIDSTNNPRIIRLLSPSLNEKLFSCGISTPHPINLGGDIAAILTLVWDGLLEVNLSDLWMTGDSAINLLNVFTRPACFSLSKQSSDSWLSIKRACESGLSEKDDITNILYCYGRLPTSSIVDEVKYLKTIEVANEVLCSTGWSHATLSRQWYRWQKEDHDSATYKLYISPTAEFLCDSIIAVARTLINTKAISWKCSSNSIFAVRPDCVCIYFGSAEDMIDAIQIFEDLFSGLERRSVPLALVSKLGDFLYWGVDPAPGDIEASSWRTWISDYLSHAILDDPFCIDARGSDWKRLAFAIKKIGIDPFSFEANPKTTKQTVSQNEYFIQ